MITDGYECRGTYWYAIGTRSTSAFEPVVCTHCGTTFLGKRKPKFTGPRFCSKSHAAKYKHEHGIIVAKPWSTDPVTYQGQHHRTRKIRGAPSSCLWGCADVYRYEWANITGNYEDTDDYVSMCVKCHRRFDSAIRSMMRLTWY